MIEKCIVVALFGLYLNGAGSVVIAQTAGTAKSPFGKLS